MSLAARVAYQIRSEFLTGVHARDAPLDLLTCKVRTSPASTRDTDISVCCLSCVSASVGRHLVKQLPKRLVSSTGLEFIRWTSMLLLAHCRFFTWCRSRSVGCCSGSRFRRGMEKVAAPTILTNVPACRSSSGGRMSGCRVENAEKKRCVCDVWACRAAENILGSRDTRQAS